MYFTTHRQPRKGTRFSLKELFQEKEESTFRANLFQTTKELVWMKAQLSAGNDLKQKRVLTERAAPRLKGECLYHNHLISEIFY